MKLLPEQDETIKYTELHPFCPLGGECFHSVYLGVNITRKDKNNIIKFARKVNPNIQISNNYFKQTMLYKVLYVHLLSFLF